MYCEFISSGCGRCDTTPLHCFPTKHNYQGEVIPIGSVQTPETGVKNGVKQSKPKIWKVKRSKAHHKLEKVKGQAS